MSILQLKPTYKVIQLYYGEINQLSTLHLPYEGAVSPAFAALLRDCGRQFNWTLAEQSPMKPRGKSIRVDGALLDEFKLLHGVWEAIISFSLPSQDEYSRQCTNISLC